MRDDEDLAGHHIVRDDEDLAGHHIVRDDEDLAGHHIVRDDEDLAGHHLVSDDEDLASDHIVSDDRIEWLVHAKVKLALHLLRERRPDAHDDAHPLLLLHGLGESTPHRLDPVYERWPGAIHGLDFTGHGRSDVPKGGGYTAEVLMADADAALAKLGPLTVCGRGLGAYVALLLAGGRAREVRGAILCDGAGLAGGGPSPSSPHVVHPDPHASGAPDPFVLAEMSLDLRPRDYAVAYVRQAAHLSPVERPILVCARNRPTWLKAVLDEADTEPCSLEEALDQLAGPAQTTP